MKYARLLLSALVLCAASAIAQETSTHTFDIAMDTRFDFTSDMAKGQDAHTGFHGRYLNLMVNGSFNDKWSYSWRQRFNKFADMGNDVFSATDWIELSYRPVRSFSFAGGKQVLWMGGYEYDAAPIDIFFSSNFWQNIACYQFGASATWHSAGDRHSLTLQACNSPFQKIGSSCYAYNLYWRGNFGCYKTIWSANLMETRRGSYASFLCLGNQLDLGPVNIQYDIVNCATDKHKYWFENFYTVGKVEYKATPWLTVMAKGGYDRLSFVKDADGQQSFVPGTGDIVAHPFYGGGFEFYPMHGSRNVKIHAVCHVFNDNNGVRDTQINVGLKWRVNLYSKK